VIRDSIVAALKEINGLAPYRTDLGERVFVPSPTLPVDQIETPFALVGFQGMDPGQTDGAVVLVAVVEVWSGPDHWEREGIEPADAPLLAQADVLQCLGVQRRDLNGAPLYRGRNSSLVRVQFYPPQAGNSRLGVSVLWRYIFHSEGWIGP
jgi:hypothetical protein